MPINVDVNKQLQDADITANTHLFRLAHPRFSSRVQLLKGLGASVREGRYHRIHQPTSYASDSAEICMAEVLYHMSRAAMNTLANNGPLYQWDNHAQLERHLVIFEVRSIANLVYIDTDQCRHDVMLTQSQGIPSVIIVHPDCIYQPLHKSSDYFRYQGKRGVVYPSARNSASELALALYLDHTRSISSIIGTINVTITLVEEGTGKPAVSSHGFDPQKNKISHTQGHYAFNSGDFATFKTNLNPASLRVNGYIDFVRK